MDLRRPFLVITQAVEDARDAANFLVKQQGAVAGSHSNGMGSHAHEENSNENDSDDGADDDAAAAAGGKKRRGGLGVQLAVRVFDRAYSGYNHLDMAPGDVTVGTYIASRGTDFGSDPIGLLNGGMQVIKLVMPANDRVEKQIDGRTSRKGEPGSSKFILQVLPKDVSEAIAAELHSTSAIALDAGKSKAQYRSVLNKVKSHVSRAEKVAAAGHVLLTGKGLTDKDRKDRLTLSPLVGKVIISNKK